MTLDWIRRHKQYKKNKTIDIALDVDRYEFKCDVTRSSEKLNEIELCGVVNNELLEELFVNISNVIGIDKSRKLLETNHAIDSTDFE